MSAHVVVVVSFSAGACVCACGDDHGNLVMPPIVAIICLLPTKC